MTKATIVCTPDEFKTMSYKKRRDAVRRQIDRTPDHWNQDVWVTWPYVWEDDQSFLNDINERRIDCGTAFCFAGWACFLAGDNFISDEEVKLRNGQKRTIGDRAAKLLGLDGDMDHELFAPFNSLEDIDDLLEAL